MNPGASEHERLGGGRTAAGADTQGADAGALHPVPELAAALPVPQDQTPTVEIKKLASDEAIEIAHRLRSAVFLGREHVIAKELYMQQAVYALLVGGHQLLFGPPGEGKSQLARQILFSVADAAVFRTQLTKMDPEHVLLGAPIVDEYLKGRYRYNTQETLIDADLAFIDEIFDANDPTLRSALGIMFEREFAKGGQVIPSTLHSCIAATNHRRESPNTQAVLSRFHFQAEITPLINDLDLVRAHRAYQRDGGKAAPPSDKFRVSMDELRAVSHYLREEDAIEIPHHVAFLRTRLIRTWEEQGGKGNLPDHRKGTIDTREHVHTDDVLKASALLRKASRVSTDDLVALQYTIPVVGTKEQREFAALAKGFTSLLSSRDLEVVDRLVELDAVVDQIGHSHLRGERVPRSGMERFLLYFNLTSEGSLTYRQIRQEAGKQHGTSPHVIALKDHVMKRLDEEQKFLDLGDEVNILAG